MDQGELRACPNCGASNRSTAKFCVTCGVRMPEPPPAMRDPYTSTPATSTWPAPPASPDPAPAAGGWGNIAPDPPVVPAPAVAPPPSAVPEPAPAPSWGSWDTAAPSAATVPANDPAAVVEGLEEALDDADVAAAAAGGAAPTDYEAPAGDALAQANELLDMLRDLLPTALAAAPVGIDANVVLADTSGDDYAALRGLIAEATARPRDIDVMMRLSQQVGDISALMDERDRLRAALQGFDLRHGS